MPLHYTLKPAVERAKARPACCPRERLSYAAAAKRRRSLDEWECQLKSHNHDQRFFYVGEVFWRHHTEDAPNVYPVNRHHDAAHGGWKG